jgi:branched-chain amino acid transport system permease protein
MRKAIRVAGISPLGLILLTMLGVAPLFIEDQYLLQLLVGSLLLGTQAMAFDFTVGLINIVNFGFAAFVGLGAYTSALLSVRLGVSPWLGAAAGAAAAGGLGLLTGLLTLRLRGIYAAVMAWFVGLTLLALAANLVSFTRGYLGLGVPALLQTTERRAYFYVIFPIAVLTLVALHSIAHSHVGLAFRAIGQNLDAARASGINPTRYRVINFTISCAFAGLLGGLYAHFVGILNPDLMDSRHTVEVLALAYIGGRGSIWGGLAASLILVPALEYLKPLMEIRLILYGLLLILVMIYLPGGLAAACQHLTEAWRNRQMHSDDGMPNPT